MTNKVRKAATAALIILLSSIGIIYTSCKKNNSDDNGIMSVSNLNPLPYEFVKITVSGTEFPLEEYFGQLGDISVTAANYSLDTLVLMIPYIIANTYKLTLDIAGKQKAIDLNIQEAPLISNPEELISGVIVDANNAITSLEDIAIETGQTFNKTDKTLLSNMVNSLNDIYIQLTESEKIELAQFIQMNPEIFSSIDFQSGKGINKNLSTWYVYYGKQIPAVIISSAAFVLTYYIPTPITKFICAGSLIYLCVKLKEIGMRTENLYSNTAIYVESQLGFEKKAADFSFQNNKQTILNINVQYRTIYAGDLNSTIPVLKGIINYLDLFQSIWAKVDDKISKIKSLFGFSDGSLTGRPSTISELLTYDTSEEEGLAQYASIKGITNSNVSVSYAVLNSSQIGVTFSTQQSTDQSFNFKYSYLEDGIIFDKLYSAILTGNLPTATTSAASLVGNTGVTLNGIVNANNQFATVTFEYGATTSYGQTVNAIPYQVSGNSDTYVSASLTGLTTGSIYHFRVKVVCSGPVVYGNDLTFTPSRGITFNPNLTYGSMNDIDGNTYKTIVIGAQTWMAENLKTTKYKDGTQIPLVTDGTTWGGLRTPGYCWYDNNATSYKAIYGAIYNWYSVNTGKLCPAGWHAPSDAEWTTLTNYLGGLTVAGGKLKEAGSLWGTTNTAATNESGFTALPGGYRGSNGEFGLDGYYGSWWTTTYYNQFSTNYAYNREMGWNWAVVARNSDYWHEGNSVRCIKD